MNEAKRIGSMTELRIMLSFIELGYNVSTPYGDSERYDFVADINGRMLRIPCKSPKPFRGVAFDIDFRRSNYRQWACKQKLVLYQPGEVDYFATWYEGQTYLIPFEEGRYKIRLRNAPTKIKYEGFHKAEDYEIKTVLEELIKEGEDGKT